MNRSLPPLALVCALAACSPSQPEATTAAPLKPATPSAAPDAPSSPAGITSLTIYSGDYAELAGGSDNAGYALVHSELHYELKDGENRIVIGRLPRAIDVAAVTLKPASPDVAINGQRYIAPLDGNVLARALGRQVAVQHTSGGARQTDKGTLVAIGNGLTLALSDGRYKLIPVYDSLSVLDSDDLPSAEPQLRWQVQAQQAGATAFALDYPTAGLAWRAEYVARLAEGDDCTLALDGWAMVANQSGVPFRDVALTLVAGEPNRVHEAAPQMRYALRSAAPAPPAADAMPTQRISGEYHAYELPGRTSLANAAIERVALFAPAPAVACKRIYETRPGTSVWIARAPRIDPGFNDADGSQPVKTTVVFDNSKKAGLGQALPAGRMRVFDGADFLGESALDHTPQGAEVRLEVGTVFDLSAERERTDFSVDRAGRMVTESFAITLGNAKPEAATIRVIEPLPRWSNWKITESSVPFVKRDAQHVGFDVDVPASGETRLTYTVIYRWPESVRP